MPAGTNKTLKEILSEAKEAEIAENFESAIYLYKEAIATDSLNEQAYDRLMMIFRKQKKYKNELDIIKKGIKVFEGFYNSKKTRRSRTITEISNRLNKTIGLSDKKGNSLYSPEPISKWKKRKLIVEKKIT